MPTDYSRLDLTNLTGVFTQTSPGPKAGLSSADILCPIFILTQLTNETGAQTLGNLHTAGSNNIAAPGLRLEGCSHLEPNLAVHSGTEQLMEYPSLVVRRPEIQVSTIMASGPPTCAVPAPCSGSPRVRASHVSVTNCTLWGSPPGCPREQVTVSVLPLPYTPCLKTPHVPTAHTHKTEKQNQSVTT